MFYVLVYIGNGSRLIFGRTLEIDFVELLIFTFNEEKIVFLWGEKEVGGIISLSKIFQIDKSFRFIVFSIHFPERILRMEVLFKIIIRKHG